MTFPIHFTKKLRFLSSLLAVVIIALLAINLPMSANADETKYERPLKDTNENAEQLIRELKEVTEKYPVLSQRFGLVNTSGFRIPMLCIGGVDAVCHSQTQNWCIQNAISLGMKPDYNYCLELANKGCCRPAVVTATK